MFDAKNVLMKSLMYTSLESWQYSVVNEMLVIVDHVRAQNHSVTLCSCGAVAQLGPFCAQGKESEAVSYAFTVPPDTGTDIAELMQSHAMRIAQVKTDEIQSKQHEKLSRLTGNCKCKTTHPQFVHCLSRNRVAFSPCP